MARLPCGRSTGPQLIKSFKSYCCQCLTVFLSPIYVSEGFFFLDHRAHLPGLAQRFLYFSFSDFYRNEQNFYNILVKNPSPLPALKISFERKYKLPDLCEIVHPSQEFNPGRYLSPYAASLTIRPSKQRTRRENLQELVYGTK